MRRVSIEEKIRDLEIAWMSEKITPPTHVALSLDDYTSLKCDLLGEFNPDDVDIDSLSYLDRVNGLVVLVSEDPDFVGPVLLSTVDE